MDRIGLGLQAMNLQNHHEVGVVVFAGVVAGDVVAGEVVLAGVVVFAAPPPQPTVKTETKAKSDRIENSFFT